MPWYKAGKPTQQPLRWPAPLQGWRAPTGATHRGPKPPDPVLPRSPALLGPVCSIYMSLSTTFPRRLLRRTAAKPWMRPQTLGYTAAATSGSSSKLLSTLLSRWLP